MLWRIIENEDKANCNEAWHQLGVQNTLGTVKHAFYVNLTAVLRVGN